MIGLVEVIDNSKTGVGKRGPWTLYKVKVSGQWYSAGFERPSFRVGETIEFSTEAGNGGRGQNIVKGSVKVSNTPAPAPSPDAPAPAPRQDGPTVDQRIVMQHSQEMAIQLVALLLSHNALPVTKADTKAGEAKRFEEISAAVNKLTVQL